MQAAFVKTAGATLVLKLPSTKRNLLSSESMKDVPLSNKALCERCCSSGRSVRKGALPVSVVIETINSSRDKRRSKDRLFVKDAGQTSSSGVGGGITPMLVMPPAPAWGWLDEPAEPPPLLPPPLSPPALLSSEDPPVESIVPLQAKLVSKSVAEKAVGNLSFPSVRCANTPRPMELQKNSMIKCVAGAVDIHSKKRRCAENRMANAPV